MNIFKFDVNDLKFLLGLSEIVLRNSWKCFFLNGLWKSLLFHDYLIWIYVCLKSFEIIDLLDLTHILNLKYNLVWLIHQILIFSHFFKWFKIEYICKSWIMNHLMWPTSWQVCCDTDFYVLLWYCFWKMFVLESCCTVYKKLNCKFLWGLLDLVSEVYRALINEICVLELLAL